MNPSRIRILTLLFGACAGLCLTATAQNSARRSGTVIITPPAINDGSMQSRAPFPSARPFDDVKGPDGVAIDILPPNTAATSPEPFLPPAPRFAILQPRTPTTPGTSP